MSTTTQMRFLYHIARGFLAAARAKPSGGSKSVTSHVYESRAGIFDIDINMHLNNASLILQTEFARWNWMAQTGIIQHALRNKWVFLVASQAVRYRYEVFAFDKLQIKTTVAAVDENWIWIRHCVWSKNKLCAQSLVRVKIKCNGSTLLPRDFFGSVNEAPLDVEAMRPENSKEIQAFLEWDKESATIMKELQQAGNESYIK